MSKRSWIVAVVLVIALIGIGTYLYFRQRSKADESLSTPNQSNNVLIVQVPDDLSQKINSKNVNGNSKQKILELVGTELNKQNNKIPINNFKLDTTDSKKTNNFLKYDEIIYLSDSRGKILNASTELKDYVSNEITLTADNSWSVQEQNILNNALSKVNSDVKSIFGYPQVSKNILVTKQLPNYLATNSDIGGFYLSSQNIIYIHPDQLNDPNWPRDIAGVDDYVYSSLVHEVIHAYNDLNNLIFINPAWTEGIAESGEGLILSKYNNSIDANTENNYYNNNPLYNSCAGCYPPSAYNYMQGQSLFSKLYYEDNNFFKNYNFKIYGKLKSYRGNVLDLNDEDKQGIRDSGLFESINMVENTPIQEWFNQQNILHPYNESKFNVFYLDFANELQINNYSNQNNANIKIYDYQNNLILEKNISVNTASVQNGKIIPKITNFNLSDVNDNPVYAELNSYSMQRLKFVVTISDISNENYGVYKKPASGIYGVLIGADAGEVVITKKNDPSVYIKNQVNKGIFINSYPDTYEKGNYILTAKVNNKAITQYINKSSGTYKTIIYMHDSNEPEISNIKNGIENSNYSLNNEVLRIFANLPNKYVNKINIKSYNNEDSLISSKEYGSYNNIVNINYRPLASFNANPIIAKYKIINATFLSDNYNIYQEKEYSASISSSSTVCKNLKLQFGGISPSQMVLGDPNVSKIAVGCDFGDKTLSNDSLGITGLNKCDAQAGWDGTKKLFNCSAPTAAGNYAVKCKTNVNTVSNLCAGEQDISGGLVVSPAINSANISNQIAPSGNLIAGQSYAVTIKVFNDGNTTWTKQAGYKLGAVGDNTNFTVGRVDLADGEKIAPGKEKTFTFNITPKITGSQKISYRMLREDIEWFGVASKELTFNVTPAVCKQPKPTFFGISPASVYTENPFAVGCSYGEVLSNDSIKIEAKGINNCKFYAWDGTKALFTCTAPTTAATYPIYCQTVTKTASNLCNSTTSYAGNLTVKSRVWYMPWTWFK